MNDHAMAKITYIFCYINMEKLDNFFHSEAM